MIKISRAYPKIPDTKNCPLKQCIAFEKLDGTNFHFIWDRYCWIAFGTRRKRFDFDEKGIQEFNKEYPDLSDAPLIFNRVYSELGQLYENKTVELYFEFLGDHSFAGLHKKDDIKRLVIIDAMINEKMLTPEEYLKSFSECQINNKDEYYMPKLIYRGKYSGKLVEDIRKGKYDVFEGAVIKGVVKGEIYRAKVKTDLYLGKLKEAFKDGWKKYWE